MGFFQDLFGGTAAKGAQEAAQTQAAYYDLGKNALDPQYAQARTDVQSGYGPAQSAWQSVYNTGQAGAKYYADLTGANGPEAQRAAQNTFQQDPGYQFALTQGLQATERQRGSGGFQGSGNVLTALTDYASGKAAQQYGDYVNRLAPFLAYNLGGAKGLSDAYTGQGALLAGLDVGQGQADYNALVSKGGALAGGIKGAADAYTQGAGNVANLGAKLLGYALAPVTGGTSALLANAGSLFMGGGSPSGYGR